jgi:hypothetical protein
MQQNMDIWMSSNGVVKMDVRGTKFLVQMQPKMDIWMSFHGVVKMDAHRIEHAKIRFDEIMTPYHHPSILYHIAAREGNLTVLKYLCSIQCPWDSSTCAAAAENGHVYVIKWCCENGSPWNSLTCTNAAKNGHLDVVQWCRQNGCPWSAITCANAAKMGIWMSSNGAVKMDAYGIN